MNTEQKGGCFVSVIIPVRNEAHYLSECLESVLANDFPNEDYEILVVDGLSEDRTREIVESFMVKHPRLKIIENPERIAPTALNRGLEKSRGNVIIRVDGHSRVATDFIRKSVDTLEQVRQAGCVGGQFEPRGKSFVGRVVAAAQTSFFGGGGGSWYGGRKSGFADTVFNPAYRRSVFEKVGHFDEDFVRDQDDEFNYRLRQAGIGIYFNPEIRGVYFPRESFIKLAKQHFQYGFWKVKVLKKHTRMMQARQLVPPLFTLFLILLVLGGCLFHWARLALWFLLATYLLSSFIAAIKLSWREEWKFVGALPIAFASMHIGYGLGFWSGVFYFALIRKGR